MKTAEYAALVIGAGAAGLAAAIELSRRGHHTLVCDREDYSGGILQQCIHAGFGLHHFGEELTGPEFAGRLAASAAAAGIPLALSTTVTSITPLPAGGFSVITVSPDTGLTRIHTRAVVLAMGSRERNRGNVRIPGDRPSGVFTAGLAQRLLNIDGLVPGRSAVIIGSGDIGLIMARRLTLCGCEVKAVLEIQRTPSGLPRNIAQCLEDFDIPLHTSCATTRIIGRTRVEAVEAAPLVNGVPDTTRTFTIPCDTVLLSVGLVPENELSSRTGVELNPVTGGPLVDSTLMTSVPGIFAAGNVLHVHDLVDWVAEEASRAGRHCANWLESAGALPTFGAELPLRAGRNVRYTVPVSLNPGLPAHLYLRSLVSLDNARINLRCAGRVIWSKNVPLVRPAEMIACSPAGLEGVRPGSVLEIEILPEDSV